MRSLKAVIGIASIGVAFGLLPALASSASAAPAVPANVTAPTGLYVSRASGIVNDIAISWKPVAGADHYMVRVNDGLTDTNYIVAGSATSFVHHGAGACTRYRVRVSAVTSDGRQASTGDTDLGSLAPGGVRNVTGLRSEAGNAASVRWTAPDLARGGSATSYRVTVTDIATGERLFTRESMDSSLAVAALNPNHMYVAKISPVNEYGTCVTGTYVLGNNRPSSPHFTAVRATADPSSAVVSWTAPSWQGYGPVTSYLVGVKNIHDKGYRWLKADAGQRSITVPELDPTVDWTFVMRAISSNDSGLLSGTVVARGSGYRPTAATVQITGGADTINVAFSAPVGSSVNYPVARVSVARANGTSGWSDVHTVTNGAGLVNFLPVPCGTYAVTVTGVGGAATQELVRTTARVCDLPKVCSVQTVSNGGFELPVLPAKTYRFVPSITSGLVWQNTAENVVEVWSTGFQGVPAIEGKQFAELNANKPGTLYQDLPTQPGTTMRWHLKHRGRQGVDTMRVMIGAPRGPLTQSGSDIRTGTSAWVQYTDTYTIPAGQTTTRFAFQSVTPGSIGNFLDDVVFTPESCQ